MTPPVTETDMQLNKMAAVLSYIKQLPPKNRHDLKEQEALLEQILLNPKLSSQEQEAVLKRISLAHQNNFLQIHTQNKVNKLTHTIDVKDFEFCEDLTEKDAIIPPFGKARNTTEQRHEKLKQISHFVISKQKKIAPGCSVVLNIIVDELLETYPLMQREYFKNAPIKQLLSIIIANAELIVSFVMDIASRKAIFHGELKHKPHNEIPSQYQEHFIKIRKRIIDDNNNFCIGENTHYSLNNSEPIKRFFNAFNLLEDYFTQEMHILFRPIDEQPDLTFHIDRLNRRASRFKTDLETNFLLDQIPQKIMGKYTKEIRELRDSLLYFCRILISGLEKLQKSKDFKNYSDLWRSLEPISYDPPLEIHSEYDKNPTEPGIGNLIKILTRFGWFFQTLKDETFHILISDLLSYGQIQNEEVDNCVEELINARKLVANYDISNIERKLLKLPEDKKSTKHVIDIWNLNFKNPNKDRLFHALIVQLEFCLRKCRKKPNDQAERALTLRRALYSLGKHLFFFNDRIRLALSDFKVQNSEVTPETKEVIAEMEDLNEMEYLAALITVESIKSLISRGFMTMESFEKATNEQQSLRAKQVGDKLIANENKSIKTKNRNQKKRKGSTVQVTLTSKNVLTQNPLGSQKVESQTQVPKKFYIEPKIIVNDVQNDLPVQLHDTVTSLKSCEQLLEALRISSLVEGDSWQKSQIENFAFLLEYLLEQRGNARFSSDQIFEEVDLLRRSVEAVLEITTIYIKTPLEAIRRLGHDSEKILYLLVADHSLPINIRKLLWNLRAVPFSLAEANRCVNYPEESFALKSRLKDSGKELINYLMKVEGESSSPNPNERVREELLEGLEQRMKRGFYFVERLLIAILYPLQEIEGSLPDDFFLPPSDLSIDVVSVQDLLCNEALFPETLTHKVISVNNREEALLTIDKALIWISIRCMAPVEGSSLFVSRKDARNIALKNCAIYLRRLKEKLGPDRSNRPMSTILGQCSLVRRLQKELLIAALYHTDSFENGKHIVDAHDVRYENSPIVLMNLMKNVSKYHKELPVLDYWLHKAHQVLSYPTPLDSKEHHFSSDQLQVLVKEVRQAAKEMKRTSDNDWILISDGQKITHQKNQELRKKLVEQNEISRIYREIAFSLQILKESLSLAKNTYF
ncbi:MAG: hypothetical protein H0T62_07235 [Parachlamydiaceae bacterium]|nr:hypothetical protein [Parachlamydiaceae bacterium]